MYIEMERYGSNWYMSGGDTPAIFVPIRFEETKNDSSDSTSDDSDPEKEDILEKEEPEEEPHKVFDVTDEFRVLIRDIKQSLYDTIVLPPGIDDSDEAQDSRLTDWYKKVLTCLYICIYPDDNEQHTIKDELKRYGVNVNNKIMNEIIRSYQSIQHFFTNNSITNEEVYKFFLDSNLRVLPYVLKMPFAPAE